MSSSSLYGIDQLTFGEEIAEYRNSWIFSPTIWNVLCQKYLAEEIATPYGYRKGLLSFDGDVLHRKLNDLMNASDNMTDRICWELSNQQGFYSKDQKLVAECIRNFLVENAGITLNEEGRLMSEGHAERFNQIADDIEKIDKKTLPYFVFKNTSVDDGVENLFVKYDEENDECIRCSLKDQDQYKLEFVVITDGKVKEFKTHDELMF